MEHGCGKGDLLKLQELIDAENSDLFDVLEFISYSRKPITRNERVAKAEDKIYAFLNEKQRAFVNFVLGNYIKAGVDELDIDKLSPALVSKFGGIYEAQRELGNVDDIKRLFVDFQRHLYIQKTA